MNQAGALEAVERILNRGGEPEQVVEEVVRALRERGAPAVVRTGGRSVGDDPGSPTATAPVVFEGATVGTIELAAGDDAFAARVATLISPYVARLR